MISEYCEVPIATCENFVELIENGNTLSFIVRFRKHLVGNLPIERLREMKSTMEDFV